MDLHDLTNRQDEIIKNLEAQLIIANSTLDEILNYRTDMCSDIAQRSMRFYAEIALEDITKLALELK